VHHAITQLFMLTPTENTALSLRLKYLTLHAERAHLRTKSGAELVVADVHEAGRIDSPRKQSVVIYIRQLLDEINEPWGPSSLIQKGIGGAGEAVVWLARKFAQMGYFTEVYGNVPDADLGFDDGGVMWRQFWEYDERTLCDVFVVWWDHLDSVAIGAAARARYVWLHYGQYFDRWPPVAAASIDAVFPMSKFHANQLPQHAQDKVVVSANGLAPHLYEDGPNDTWNLIYASHPFYGLDTLLRMWPSIAAALPNVTLHVCASSPPYPHAAICIVSSKTRCRYYGFTPGIDRYLSHVPEGAAFKKKIMDSLARGPRIVYHGMVGARELARAVAAAGFYVYPCTIAEISSISLMRAQAMGAIPITSRHINSALPETSGIFDLGPPARPGLISDDDDWQSQFVQAVVRAVNAPRGEMDSHRCVCLIRSNARLCLSAARSCVWVCLVFVLPHGRLSGGT
jgi:glycosyltransferase involved in cell wall biosynthesis